eukprot:comp12414_c1_seq1/m.7315 comp12414_c1_seq1/g.7315  ORF comp12414_c1_seq1/g.7315 comp12414_c1_seq1/m.7315 type:complete len:656 (-) comp12414_c1_seq1:107-2074(-)
MLGPLLRSCHPSGGAMGKRLISAAAACCNSRKSTAGGSNRTIADILRDRDDGRGDSAKERTGKGGKYEKREGNSTGAGWGKDRGEGERGGKRDWRDKVEKKRERAEMERKEGWKEFEDDFYTAREDKRPKKPIKKEKTTLPVALDKNGNPKRSWQDRVRGFEGKIKHIQAVEEERDDQGEKTFAEKSKIGMLKVIIPEIDPQLVKSARGFNLVRSQDQEKLKEAYTDMKTVLGIDAAAAIASRDLGILLQYDPTVLRTKVNSLTGIFYPKAGVSGNVTKVKGDQKRKEKNDESEHGFKIKDGDSLASNHPLSTNPLGYVLGKHPALLRREMRAIKETLKKLSSSFPNVNMRGIIREHPQFLLHDYKEIIAPKFEFFGKLLPNANKKDLFVKAPQAFFQTNERLTDNYTALGRHLGLLTTDQGQEILQRIVSGAPQLLVTAAAQTTAKLDKLYETLSFIQEDVIARNLIPRHPELAVSDPFAIIKPNMEELQSIFGQDRGVLEKVITAEPALLTVRHSKESKSISVRYHSLVERLSTLTKPKTEKPEKPDKTENTEPKDSVTAIEDATSNPTNHQEWITEDLVRDWLQDHPSALLSSQAITSYSLLTPLARSGYRLTWGGDQGDRRSIEIGEVGLAEVLAMNGKKLKEKFPNLNKK